MILSECVYGFVDTRHELRSEVALLESDLAERKEEIAGLLEEKTDLKKTISSMEAAEQAEKKRAAAAAVARAAAGKDAVVDCAACGGGTTAGHVFAGLGLVLAGACLSVGVLRLKKKLGRG